MGDLGPAAVRYHLTALGRFIAISLPLLLLIMALFGFGLEALDLEPSTASLAARGLERTEPLPMALSVGTRVIETLALTALFLMVQGRGGAWWMDGLLAAAIAWVFRGPLLVVSVVAISALGAAPWWAMSLRWLVLYAICGLALALVARVVGVKR